MRRDERRRRPPPPARRATRPRRWARPARRHARQLAQSRQVTGDHRQTSSHGLEHREAEPSARLGMQSTSPWRSARKGRVIDRANEVHPVPDPELAARARSGVGSPGPITVTRRARGPVADRASRLGRFCGGRCSPNREHEATGSAARRDLGGASGAVCGPSGQPRSDERLRRDGRARPRSPASWRRRRSRSRASGAVLRLGDESRVVEVRMVERHRVVDGDQDWTRVRWHQRRRARARHRPANQHSTRGVLVHRQARVHHAQRDAEPSRVGRRDVLTRPMATPRTSCPRSSRAVRSSRA